MNETIQKLLKNGPVVTDGAWGTQLQALGLPTGDCGDLFNLTHPERVEKVAGAYVAAGSQIILTNTFRANRIALADYGFAEKTAEINRSGVEISCVQQVKMRLFLPRLVPAAKCC
ncbi:MAG: homocysteine S-methyltransferase family protein [Calditrichae bacterium]|nr:homocysteine S-methyltransferase family protein [Calditrichia bacterium]